MRNILPRLTNTPISRRAFLRMACMAAAALASHQFFSRFAWAKPAVAGGRTKKAIKGEYDLVAVKGTDPYCMTEKAIELMGGMERFVPKNGVVVVKPNIGWDRTPEQAANTNPRVVAALIDLSFRAGAKKVNVFDAPCNDPRRCYQNSGIKAAAEEHGASVFIPDEWNTIGAHFAYASPMEGWPIFRDALECDTFINVPILKHHGLTGLTLSMKNLMGVCSGDRGQIHADIGRKLVDLTDFISPELTVIDGFRVLMRNGPTGGNLADVQEFRTVLAATDPTLADAYAARLVGQDPLSVPYIQNAAERSFGSTNIERSKTIAIELPS